MTAVIALVLISAITATPNVSIQFPEQARCLTCGYMLRELDEPDDLVICGGVLRCK